MTTVHGGRICPPEVHKPLTTRESFPADGVGSNFLYTPDTAHYGVSWRDLLAAQDDNTVDCAFCDPQWRDDLDKLKFGNEGERMGARCDLPQQGDADIVDEMTEICRVTKIGCYVFLWTNKNTICEGNLMRFCGVGNPHQMKLVDLLVWYNPSDFGMGARARSVGDFMLVFQKGIKSKAHWLRSPSVPRVWTEGISRNQKKQRHTHAKPVKLQATLIECVTPPGGLVLDCNGGSFGVMEAAHSVGRHFIGCEILSLAEIQAINNKPRQP